MIQHRLLLILDNLLEGTNGRCACDRDGKYVGGIVTIEQTVEFEKLMGLLSWSNCMGRDESSTEILQTVDTHKYVGFVSQRGWFS